MENIPDKSYYFNTTSLKFKKDLVDFFKDKKLNNVLEIGTNEGHTTNILSKISKKVYTIELEDRFIQKARHNNLGSDNIVFIKGDAYDEKIYNENNLPNFFDLVFIDCVHEYTNILYDTNRALNYLDPKKGIYLAYDDYGNDGIRSNEEKILSQPVVYTAVQDIIKYMPKWRKKLLKEMKI